VGDRLRLRETVGDRPRLRETVGDRPRLRETVGDRPRLRETVGDRLRLPETHQDCGRLTLLATAAKLMPVPHLEAWAGTSLMGGAKGACELAAGATVEAGALTVRGGSEAVSRGVELAEEVAVVGAWIEGISGGLQAKGQESGVKDCEPVRTLSSLTLLVLAFSARAPSVLAKSQPPLRPPPYSF